MLWLLVGVVVVLIIVAVYLIKLTSYRINASRRRRTTGDREAQTQQTNSEPPTFASVARDITSRVLPDRRPGVDPSTGEPYVPIQRPQRPRAEAGSLVVRVAEDETGGDPELPSYNDRTATTQVPVPNLPAEPPAAYQSTMRLSRESDITFVGDEPPKYDSQPVVRML
ncbi:hypothetical protein BCR39DRAFT_515006 [Naematelia encephala]|uniref:Uncharacterized protein n=1 Tax=Naematelia encephala TaxID=71784 RepID=A0A1Y2BL56_9TREE|nr:hypothetical protein BCR39DRAFT_515006 [Naematelia encephala]